MVLLSQVLAHSCNIGYETQRNLVLSKCNGELVRSLKHLKQVDVMLCMYCMYVHHLCSTAYIYFTAEMYVVVLYTDDVQLLHGIFLIYDQCIYSPENICMYVCMYVCMYMYVTMCSYSTKYFLYMTSVCMFPIEKEPKLLLPNINDFIFASRSKYMYVCMFAALYYVCMYVEEIRLAFLCRIVTVMIDPVR